MTLHYQETGSPGAPVILFLHGAGTSSWMWEGQTEALTDYHCFNLDLPGHGASNQIEWVSLADTAKQVAQLAEEILRRPDVSQTKINLVGLSLGAYVSLYLLANHHELIDRVVISGVTVAPLEMKKWQRLQMQVVMRFYKLSPIINSNARMMNIPQESLAAFTEMVRATSITALRRITDEIFSFSLPSALELVHSPTLIVAGSEEMAQIREAVATLTALMPQAEGRIVPDVHHGWNGERPDLFNAMLSAWFSDSSLPAELIVVGSPDLVLT